MSNFWQTLPKPFLILAPMEDVTDSVFRQIVSECAAPDVYFTEFVSVDGLVTRGRSRIIHRLKYTEKERPIVAQIWGLVPQNYETIARELVEMGFDGIDINMGCPEKNVTKKGACIALCENRPLATEIIQATKIGAQGKIPVSIKTRIGLKTIITEDWIEFLLKQDIAALTIHGRTAKEMSEIPAHWDEIGKAVKIRNSMNIETLIIGNGDVKDWQDAYQKVEQHNVDGVMIGRGIFQNLWAFDTKNNHQQLPLPEMLKLLLKHIDLFENTWGNTKPFVVLKKYFKMYIHGFTGASDFRDKLMRTKSAREALTCIEPFLKKAKDGE